MIAKKIDRIQKSLRKQRLDGLILCNESHETRDDFLYYILLTNLEKGVMFIPASGKPTLYAISFESADLSSKFPDIAVVPLKTSFAQTVKLHLKKGRIGYRHSLSHKLFTAIAKNAKNKFGVWDDNLVMGVKSQKEIENLKFAAKITDKVFRKAILNWGKFTSEKDAANFINFEFTRMGFEPSFPTIVASGKNAAFPHHSPGQTKLRAGFCVIDMGVRAFGYCSDMTRTIYLGRPSKQEKQLYSTLLSIQKILILNVKPNLSAADLDKKCRDLLGNLSDQFIHGLGHGLGTQVHEWPSVSKNSMDILQNNNVITIEPGLYKKNAYGMRIEDDVIVTKKEAEVLTKSTKKLICLPTP